LKDTSADQEQFRHAGNSPARRKKGKGLWLAPLRSCPTREYAGLPFLLIPCGLPISPASTQKNKVKSQIKNMAVTILSRLGAVVVALAA
jgi:hypothetical protein